jgi:hypothetical protein
MNSFLKVFKIKSVLSVLAPMVFTVNVLLPCCSIQEAASDSWFRKLFREPEMILKRVWYYFSKSQADDWLLAFWNAELKLPILFEAPQVLL